MTLIGNRTLTVNPGTVLIGGVISGDATTNTFTKSGAGDLVFNGSSANTYTGATTVNDGILRLSSSAVAIAGDLVIGNGPAAIRCKSATSTSRSPIRVR
jgi:autotransporter-associated beta strand protein